MRVDRIAIIGLGMIGSSLARALKERTGIDNITAVDINREWLDCAARDGVIRQGFTKLDDSIYDCDIIFICTPFRKAIEYLDNISSKVKSSCIITDVCSTKTGIINHINNMPAPPCFIGGHPMTGSEKTGYHAGSAHLFENAYYILTPSKSTNNSGMELMKDIVSSIGAIPIVLHAGEHDRITAAISHIPHIIASVLVNLVASSDSPDGKMHMLAAGGFRDITRIASSSPEVWENIVMSNKQQISAFMDEFVIMLEAFKNFLAENNSSAIYSFFEKAKLYRDSMPTAKKGLIAPYFELVVDVVDKPGIIGQIATLLGSRNINIKNINVSNSREFEQGCLTITLPDSASLSLAYDILVSNGYKAFKNL